MSQNGTGLHVAAMEIHDFLAIRQANLTPGKVALFDGKNRVEGGQLSLVEAGAN